MSSNIRLSKVCLHCNSVFTAKTTVTKYCSLKCASKAYKKRKRDSKLNQASKENENMITNAADLSSKTNLSIKEATEYLGISRTTIYRLIANKKLEAFKIGRRTILRKSDLDKVLTPIIPSTPQSRNISQINKVQFYYIKEVEEKFGISSKALYEIIKRNKIPKMKEGKYTYIPKEDIDRILKK